MLFDYVLRNGRIAGGSADPVDVGVSDGRTAVIAPGSAMSARDGSRDIALDARLMIPGFVETHIRLDKSCISDRCNWVTGTLQEAIAAAAECGGGGTGAAAAGDEARPHHISFSRAPAVINWPTTANLSGSTDPAAGI